MLFFLLKLLRCEDDWVCHSEDDSILIKNISIPLKKPASLLSAFSISWILLQLVLNLRRVSSMLLERSNITHYWDGTQWRCNAFPLYRQYFIPSWPQCLESQRRMNHSCANTAILTLRYVILILATLK